MGWGLRSAFSKWARDQSGPRDSSFIRATSRSPSSRSDREPMTEMRGSDPWSSRSSSRKVRRGRYSGPRRRRFIAQACSPSASRNGSSSEETSLTRAWG